MRIIFFRIKIGRFANLSPNLPLLPPQSGWDLVFQPAGIIPKDDDDDGGGDEVEDDDDMMMIIKSGRDLVWKTFYPATRLWRAVYWIMKW